MKIKTTLSLLALFATSAFSQVAAAATSTPVAINLAVKGTADELTALERAKVDYIFGTPEQKLAALTMYGTDFHGIGYGPEGPARGDYAGVVEKLQAAYFPAFPPGTFRMTDVKVLSLQPGCTIVSYFLNGPGPDGKPWNAFLSSTWVQRGAEWKTVYYQATVVPQP